MISDFYTETLVLLDHSSSTGGYWSTGGGYTTDVSVSAAVNLMSGDERAQYGAIGYDARYKAYCDVSTDVYEGRRCRWGGDTFEIVGIPKNTLQKGHHLKILLRDIGDA